VNPSSNIVRTTSVNDDGFSKTTAPTAGPRDIDLGAPIDLRAVVNQQAKTLPINALSLRIAEKYTTI
jgi:hypothetical protein